MYWWKVDKLAEDLREGRVSEKERLKYYLAFILLYGIGLEIAFYHPETFNMVRLISSVVDVTIIITGTMLCYWTNRGGDNVDFVGRMICLSWPIIINVGVLYLAIRIPVGITFGSNDSDLLVAIFAAFFDISLYWLLYKYVKIVAQPKATNILNE